MSWVKKFREGAPPAPPKMPDGKKTVEEWAEEFGHLPEIIKGKKMVMPGTHVPGKSIRMQIGVVSRAAAPRYNKKYLVFRQAQLHHGWVIGTELTKEEFLAALRAPHEGKTMVVCR
jgi:hypothetical protein